jgi:hypothetical protein
MLKVHDAHKQYWASFKDTTLHNSPNLWCLPWEADATSGEASLRPNSPQLRAQLLFLSF